MATSMPSSFAATQLAAGPALSSSLGDPSQDIISKTVSENVVSEEGADLESKSVERDTSPSAHLNAGELHHKNDDYTQFGVQRVEALTQVWPRKALIASYIAIWVTYFVMFMQSNSLNVLSAFITSTFGYHSLTPTITVVAQVVSGVVVVSIAKGIDIFGRPHGLAFGIIGNMLGMIMMAASQNIETTAAAEVFWQVGFNSLFYTINIFVADTSSLKNRALMLGLVASPNLIVIWVMGYFNDAYIAGPGWKWAFGTFAFIGPAVSLPIFLIVWYYTSMGARALSLPPRQTYGSPARTFLFYAREFDVIGLSLFSVGISLFLLSFNLYALQTEGWRTPMIIAFIVLGGTLTVAAILWEIYFAPVTCLPFQLLKNRTVLGSAMVSAVLFFSYYLWASYFTSFLLVVNGLDVQKATYVTNINGFGGAVFNIAIGWYISRVGRFKTATLIFAIPLCILGLGLMIYFRRPDQHVGFLVMCQIFLCAGSTITTQTTTLATMAAVSHQDLAIAIALISICSSIGGAVGSTVSSTIWQNVFQDNLIKYLPVDDLENILLIYSDINTQLSYPEGTATRIAIQKAYGVAQSRMLAVATASWALGALGVVPWQNLDVKTLKQVSGQVV